jgi:hypothetical protein
MCVLDPVLNQRHRANLPSKIYANVTLLPHFDLRSLTDLFPSLPSYRNFVSIFHLFYVSDFSCLNLLNFMFQNLVATLLMIQMQRYTLSHTLSIRKCKTLCSCPY